MSKYISKFKGDFPLIISVPHGGNLKPRFIPDRKNGVRGLDRKTRFTAKSIKKELAKAGMNPYLVILNLSRNKVDVNRPKKEGCENPEAEVIWEEYHKSLQDCINECRQKFGKCFLIDLHGQKHDNNVQIGYCLNQDQLLKLLEDRLPVKCSIAHSDLNAEEELVFGRNSFSHILEKNGYPAVPNKETDLKSEEKYFSGAYITRHYDFENHVRGFQLELNYSHIRDSYFGIKKFSKNFAKSLKEYFGDNNL